MIEEEIIVNEDVVNKKKHNKRRKDGRCHLDRMNRNRPYDPSRDGDLPDCSWCM